VYNSMFRYININDILKLILGIILSSLIFYVFIGNFEKFIAINYLLLFFISFSILVSYRLFIKILFS
jgi:FlaA1/EpsC-like NDP-sugar epimerase